MIHLAMVVALGLGNAAGASLIVDVQVIEASNSASAHGGQSTAIRDLGATLRYKSYQTLSQDQRTLAVGDATQLYLPEGTVAHITALGIDGSRKKRTVRLRVRIDQGGKSLDTEYSVRDGGTVFVSAGQGRTSDSALVLAIAPHLK